MDSDVMQDRTDELLDEEDGGATLILTEAGWESTDYLDPGDDWGRLPDGSYLSPDGLIRTWPAGAG